MSAITRKELRKRLKQDHGNIKDQLDEILSAVAEINNQLSYLDEDIEFLDDLEVSE